ncbi:unnamed protein product [Pelagomonas calceolata]|uniref:Nickel/cobalt efflux system n=1 Tax=Pelagomonas calceolata TaxID=35677 RepID=A0A8J2SFI6_9STRA|nr:unnamed protein product [Pelagomonas calceolata]
MHTGYASIAVDASSSAASAATQSQDDAWRPQHPQRCTAAAQGTPPQPARRKDANSPTSVIDARDDKQFAPLGAAQNHAVARVALLGVALTLGVLLVMLLALGGTYPALVGPGLLALGFGLRHGMSQCVMKDRLCRYRVDGVGGDAIEHTGVDCDHIAAIDNVARKLSAAQRPAALVGLWFSLGHSTVVVLLCAAVSTGSAYARAHVASLATAGANVGDAVSSITLIIIGAINLAAVGPQYRAWRTARRGVAGDHGHGPLHAHAASLEDDGEEVRVEAAGCLVGCACCRYVLGRVDSAWKMYPVGFLFGLGFDTASEVGLLALAALGGAGAADGVPAVLVMLLPALFAAGMALVDTCDGLLVLLALAKGDGADAGALLLGCGLTAASASASLGIGLVTAGGLLARCFPSTFGPLAAVADALDAHTTAVGLLIVALFAAALAAARFAPACRRPSYASLV